MPRVLTHFLVFHWAVVLSLLAGLIALGGGLPGIAGLEVFGGTPADPYLAIMALPGVQALVSGAFALCAVFFWWALCAGVLPAAAGDHSADEVLRLAFSMTAALMTTLLVVGTFAKVEGLFSVMATHFAALTASFVAIRAEQRQAAPHDEGLRRAVRAKALDASTTAGLPQFTPRRNPSWAGWEAER